MGNSASIHTHTHQAANMLDITLRPLKDNVFAPLSRSVPASITPVHITAAAFVAGLISCLFACAGHRTPSLVFWAANRALDCLDGAVARHRDQQTVLGGFLDLLGDFIVYALVPVACVVGNGWSGEQTPALVVALLEASFWINNFVLLYIAALVEKGKDELTSLAMRPALIEGFESAVFFTLMLAVPSLVGVLSAVMFMGVVFGTGQRVRWVVLALSRPEETAGTKKKR